jgi:hypothetical protein
LGRRRSPNGDREPTPVGRSPDLRENASNEERYPAPIICGLAQGRPTAPELPIGVGRRSPALEDRKDRSLWVVEHRDAADTRAVKGSHGRRASELADTTDDLVGVSDGEVEHPMRRHVLGQQLVRVHPRRQPGRRPGGRTRCRSLRRQPDWCSCRADEPIGSPSVWPRHGRPLRPLAGGRPRCPLWDHAQAAPPSTRMPKGDYLDAHTSSVATCAASIVSNQPTVVMGERPGRSSRRR